MFGKKKTILLIFFWIISNVIWTAIIVPATFSSGILFIDDPSPIEIKHYIDLLAMGIFQGLLISICQGAVLWFYKLPKNKIIRLSLANLISSIIGAFILCIYFYLSGMNYNSLLLVVIWNLSLFLVGVSWGFVAGNSTFQKVDWAVSTGFAYSLWITAFWIVVLCFVSSALKSNSNDLYRALIVAALFSSISFCLNIPIIIKLLSRNIRN